MNKYQRAYSDLIEYRTKIQPIQIDSKICYHLHHIKPKSIFPDLANEPTNLVRLTVLEHIYAHQYLKNWYAIEYGKDSNEYICMFMAYSYLVHNKKFGYDLSPEEAAVLMTEKQRIQKMQIWITDGKQHKKILKTAIIPSGWRIGRPISICKDYVWINNGKCNKRISKLLPIPKGWIKGRLEKNKWIWINDGKNQKMIQTNDIPIGWKRGRLEKDKWIYVNNGVIEKMVVFDAIPAGFVKGKLHIRKRHKVNI